MTEAAKLREWMVKKLHAANPKFTEFSQHQIEALDLIDAQYETHDDRRRVCLYHRTGGGKSITSLAMVKVSGFDEVLVIAPPITHGAWAELAKALEMNAKIISHAKFRMKDFKVSKHAAIICDEFHLLGGVHGKGWRKFDLVAASLPAPVVICSATPEYNDAERVYCVIHALDPGSARGGYLQFLYTHCTTEQNRFGITPNVTGFLRYKDAKEFLASLPYVAFLPDTSTLVIEDVVVHVHDQEVIPEDLTKYGLNRRSRRMMASGIEMRHQLKYHRLLTTDHELRPEVYEMLSQIAGEATTPVLIFCESTTVLIGLDFQLRRHSVRCAAITGHTSTKYKEVIRKQFIAGDFDVLAGTASLATGMDGVDKMCDTLIILDDTDDDAKRRQLIGRILPRGLDTDESGKSVYRIQVCDGC